MLICVGIGMFFVKTLVGGILSALGAVVALVGVFFYFKGQINLVKTVNGNSQNGKISELENEISQFYCHGSVTLRRAESKSTSTTF